MVAVFRRDRLNGLATVAGFKHVGRILNGALFSSILKPLFGQQIVIDYSRA